MGMLLHRHRVERERAAEKKVAPTLKQSVEEKVEKTTEKKVRKAK